MILVTDDTSDHLSRARDSQFKSEKKRKKKNQNKKGINWSLDQVVLLI